MIAMNKSYRITMILVSSVAFFALTIGIMNEIKRRKIINYHKEVLQNISTEIDAYKSLGFTDQDTVIEVSQSRLSRARQELDAVKNNSRFLFKKDKEKSSKKDRLENILRINREMAANFRAEIQEYLKLGLPQKDKAIKKAKGSLTKLVVEISDIENKLNMLAPDDAIDPVVKEKIEKLVAVNKESLDLYKQELEEYTKLGLVQQDQKVKYVHKKINGKVAEIESLEKYLQ